MNKFGEMYDDDLNSLVQFFKTEGEYTDDQIKNYTIVDEIVE